MDRFLFISDTQIPFEAPKALEFCKAVQKEFKIPPNNVYHVGDEVDFYHGSLYPKTPDATMTAHQELALTVGKLQRWYDHFPKMKLATSNHGLRYVKKAIASDIPSKILKSYRDILGAPAGWQWRDEWKIPCKHPITMIHGMGYTGHMGHKNAALDYNSNLVMGHLHSHAGIVKISTAGKRIWGANAGCLINPESFAFDYGKYNRNKPILTVCVVIDSGLTPMLIPYERF